MPTPKPQIESPARRRFMEVSARYGFTTAVLAASGGEAGSLAEKEGCGGFEGSWPGVETPVVFKVYPDQEWARTMMAQEMSSARAAANTGAGPRVYGEIKHQGKIGFAMEKVEGNFATRIDDGYTTGMTAKQAAAAKAQVDVAKQSVTTKTVQDVRRFGDRIFMEGKYCEGDIQGLVDAKGNWRPIDFQSYRPVPTDGTGRNIAWAKHQTNIGAEASKLEALARANAATKVSNPVPAP